MARKKSKISFIAWKKRVDDIVYKELELHLDDLPDEDFRMAYDNNINAIKFAKFIIKINMEFLLDM